jgi:hypothetical protein
MFRYVNDVSILAQNIIKDYCTTFECAIDATLGNGYDTDFLSNNFSEVYSFDIQKSAIDNYSVKRNKKVNLIHDSHEFIDKYIDKKIDCAMYNLGYLPGGDKTITTKVHSTLKSIECTLGLIKENGLITICIYSGHEEGTVEREAILSFISDLPKKEFGVMLHSFINRKNAPELIVIEKK